MSGSSWATSRDVCETASHIATIGAIVFGGVIAWRRWGREKPLTARGDLAHHVSVARLDMKTLLLHVVLEVKNTGTVPLHLKSGWTEVRKVSPVDEDVRAVLDAKTLADDGLQIR